MAIINVAKKKIHSPPGTLFYTGQYLSKNPKIEILKYNAKEFKRFEVKNVNEIEDDPNYVQWINVVGLNHISLIEELGQRFEIHKLNLEDIVDVSQRSKLEQKSNYLFTIFKMFYLEKTSIVSEHVSIIMLKNILITFQEMPKDIFDPIRIRLEKNEGRIRTMNVDYLFYSLTDSLVDQYFNSLHAVEQRFNEIETLVIELKSKKMDDIYQLRKDLLYLRNGIVPVKEIVQNIAHSENGSFSSTVKQYFVDVLDNASQVVETISEYREMVNGLYEAQVSNRNDEMNKIIMTLTIFSVIFIPLSFLAGLFGMNFLYMPLLTYENSFILFISFCLLIVILMLFLFKRKKWF